MKKLLFDNLATKFMALFLAALTWMYLFTQDTDQHDLDVLFMPRIDTGDFAYTKFKDANRNELNPGREFKVRVIGPKGDVRALRPRTFKCEPLIDPQALAAPYGTYEFSLKRGDFDLPDKYAVDPLPSAEVTLRYAKNVTRKIRILAPPGSYEGEPAPDHRVDSITPVPAEIEARVPADFEGPDEVTIKPVRLDRNQGDFTVAGQLQGTSVKPLRPFEVRVRIIPVPKTARLTLDLSLNAKPENLKRIELEDKSIVVELRGPEELVREAEKRPAAFQPYVVVTDTDMAPEGPKTVSQLGCYILDPKFRDQLAVILMPDEKPENRQVKIKVNPK